MPKLPFVRVSIISVLVGLAALSGCTDLLGPERPTQTFALRSINGVALDSTENLWERCAPANAVEGAELMMIGVTMTFDADGRFQRRYDWRWRAPVSLRPTPDHPAQRDSQLDRSRYVRFADTFYVEGESTAAVYDVDAGGTITTEGLCGAWRFTRE